MVTTMAFKSIVKPISLPVYNWKELAQDVYDLTGHSVTKSLDGSNLKLTPVAKILISLESFSAGTGVPPIQAIENANISLYHVHISFLICTSASNILRLSEVTGLNVISTQTTVKGQRLAIVTGSLRDWIYSIISLCSSSYNIELRHIANECLNYFSLMGLKTLFSSVKRKDNNDGTFLLEHKK